MLCPKCQHEISEETLFCQYCGSPLPPATDSPGQQETAEPTAQNDMNGDAENATLWKTDKVDEIEHSGIESGGPARFDERARLSLHIGTFGNNIAVDVRQASGVVLGRFNPATNQAPDVDLTPYEGKLMGVSRDHARFDTLDGVLYLTDLGSFNGTYLNGSRLERAETRTVRDGDTIHLGQLKIHLYFVVDDDS